jgi:glucose/arabinose dehydrogenase
MSFRKAALIFAFAALLISISLYAQQKSQSSKRSSGSVITGHAAFTDYSQEKPGVRRKITIADLPEPDPQEAVENHPRMAARPENTWPQAPAGFKVTLFAKGLDYPRLLRTAPNGDIFLAESRTGEIKVFRGVDAEGKAKQMEVFATGLERPWGIAFYPPGPDPKWVYVGNTGSVVRFPYKSGDLKATGKWKMIVPDLPTGARVNGGGHWTRDIAFSPDGKKMFVSVGSRSNNDDSDTHPAEKNRADILEFNPDGSGMRIFASGIRNPVGVTFNPTTHELWASVNERDDLGNNLVPDYITHVQDGGFYGWPWLYMGNHYDPAHVGKHPELKGKVITPDVILQPHFASLQMLFYEGKQFPQEYDGDAFAAEHGSWNRDKRSGYEVIRVPMKSGHATGEYEDFLTGFVNPDGTVWGRPVGLTVMQDGSLLVSDDGSKSIWRVSYEGPATAGKQNSKSAAKH